MNIKYFPEYFNLVVSFEQRELHAAVEILRMSVEEAKDKDMRVPGFDEAYFTSLSTSVKKKSIVFDFGVLEVGMLFLDNYYDVAEQSMAEVTVLGKSVNKTTATIAPYCVEKCVLH